MEEVEQSLIHLQLVPGERVGGGEEEGEKKGGPTKQPRFKIPLVPAGRLGWILRPGWGSAAERIGRKRRPETWSSQLAL